MLDDEGSGTIFLRDLELKRKDWFYVGVADVTVSENSTNGPAALLQGANAPQPYDSTVDGRLAFYVNGKFGDHWKLTASADTNEGPIEDLFSNLLDKSPDSLFRRIDPDYHYPTFGDDATVDEMAPTMGKFYVKLSQHENYGLWGNFKVGYLQNELAQVDRGLYGANAHYEAGKSTTLRRAALRRRRLRGGARHRCELRGVPRYRRLAVLPAPPGHPRGLRERAHRAARQGLAHRDRRREPAAGARLRHRLSAGTNPAVRAAFIDRGRQPVGAQRRSERRRGLPRRELRVHAGFDELDAVAGGGQGHVWLNDHVKLGSRRVRTTTVTRTAACTPPTHVQDERGVVAQGASGPQRRLVSTRCDPTTAATASTATTR
jgi:hypothetical protein